MATPLYNEIYDYIEKQEKLNGIRLTEDAKNFLIIPLVEYQRIADRPVKTQYSRNVNQEFSKWKNSLSSIVKSMKNDPAEIDEHNTGRETFERTSLSAAKAIAGRWCDIPPICGETRKK